MAHQPSDTLKNRSFVGLIVAQFLAGFNDQAIHAAAMFFALSTGILREDQAISLMPILFYAPWAIFCTLAGYFADRYSKTYAIIIWKFAEIVISLILLLGFYLWAQYQTPVGPWLVMGCVFLMGTHAAFFAPAKYGAMPEILKSHVLSKGNGVLESTTFLAAILGTVCGGLLSFQFRGQEIWIGVIFLGLSGLGAIFSLIVAYLPPGNPTRPFPTNLFKPLWQNLKVIFQSRPLALAALGIAFFIFMVAYMRQVMYMHGQTRNPPWDEFKVSLIVASVALGVGLGAPMAGNLSGGKVELGLVPVGCFGMILATILAAVEIQETAVLIGALIGIGFFSGFYMVPLYTLLQHRAPKTTKGDLIATSNFINVTGAIAASILFFVLVQAGRMTNLTPEIQQQDNYAKGTLKSRTLDDHGHLSGFVVTTSTGKDRVFTTKLKKNQEETIQDEYFPDEYFEDENYQEVEESNEGVLSILSGPNIGDEVIVSWYNLGDVYRYNLRAADTELKPVYDNRFLPRYLFLGAAGMCLAILILLKRKLPDFFTRSLFWWRSLGKFRLQAVGMQHLPTHGPVILATNCETLERSLQLVSATDRSTTLVLHENGTGDAIDHGLLSRLAHRTNMLRVVTDSPEEWHRIREKARRVLQRGNLLGVSIEGASPPAGAEAMLQELKREFSAPVVPVYCGVTSAVDVKPRIRVVFGPQFGEGDGVAEMRQTIRRLGETAEDATHDEGH